jgi:hypothetical protein
LSVEGLYLERTDWTAVRLFRVSFFFIEPKSESPSNAGA